MSFDIWVYPGGGSGRDTPIYPQAYPKRVETLEDILGRGWTTGKKKPAYLRAFLVFRGLYGTSLDSLLVR